MKLKFNKSQHYALMMKKDKTKIQIRNLNKKHYKATGQYKNKIKNITVLYFIINNNKLTTPLNTL